MLRILLTIYETIRVKTCSVEGYKKKRAFSCGLKNMKFFLKRMREKLIFLIVFLIRACEVLNFDEIFYF